MDRSQKAKDIKWQEALNALANGENAKAEALFHEVIQDNTNTNAKIAKTIEENNKQNAENWVHVGVLESLDDTEKARDAFEQALALDPENETAKNILIS